MKNSWLWGLFLLGMSCARNGNEITEEHSFTCDTVYACMPVMNQGRTQTCWAYAMASMLEAEELALGGDSIRLSPMYVVRQKYLKQFDLYYYSRGREEIRGGALGHTFLNLWEKEGLVPLDAYRGCAPDIRWNDHRRLLKEIKTLAAKAVRHRDRLTYRKQVVALLDQQMGVVPDTFVYRGTTYTPRSFADSLFVSRETYVQLTSFTHHPFHESFVLEVPDNWEHASYYNLPLDELEATVRRALQNGRTVVWDGDVSEDTFLARQGFAIYPDSSGVSQAERQSGFEHFETTDDHMMHIIGTAHDEEGHFYYVVKNSWGLIGPYKGICYLSEDYFRAKTISVVLPAQFLSLIKR